jgi:hypothetical protein
MATPKKKIEDPSSRTASRPQAERRLEASPIPPTRAAGELSQEAVSQRAREIWERNGRQPDRDLENWLQAEAELRGS